MINRMQKNRNANKTLTVFNKSNVKLIDKSKWQQYQKKVLTKATKVNCPFTVETTEGIMNCKDGYLAIDARGYPYPIATKEFELIYDKVVETDVVKRRKELYKQMLAFNGKSNTADTIVSLQLIATELYELGVRGTIIVSEDGEDGINEEVK